jgi:hypothetical protein
VASQPGRFQPPRLRDVELRRHDSKETKHAVTERNHGYREKITIAAPARTRPMSCSFVNRSRKIRKASRTVIIG